MAVTVVWFRRDLRLSDNPAISKSLEIGNATIFLYNLDGERLERKDVDPIHIEWELDCLRCLQEELKLIGGKLLFNCGDIVEKLEELNEIFNISHILGNEETGLQWSWDRDKRVAHWCRKNNVKFTEFPSNGIIRGLKSRDNWKRLRDRRMNQEIFDSPTSIESPQGLPIDKIPDILELGLEKRELVDRPIPGEREATLQLLSFLGERGRKYRSHMSSPSLATTACSRLSPYISVGCISIRQILHHTGRKSQIVKINPRSKENSGWTGSIKSFQSRLAWHCHFIQRLDSELTMDSIALNDKLDSYLERKMDNSLFHAWANGFTGWPFFDACMRSLIATGWINFRMRAMLQSVASYTLWLPWQETGLHLARLFLDYEPGIHWSQVQMQSGVTGINSIRAYSISKQSKDQDPEGKFIRKWVPELRNVPNHLIHSPWTMSETEQKEHECIIGEDYPIPILDEKEARKIGISRSYSAKGKPESKARSIEVYHQHGSRKRRNKT